MRRSGIWDLPLQSLPFPGHSFEVLSMDYNILANQSKNTTQGVPANYPGWRTQATATYLGGFRRAYETNRAPCSSATTSSSGTAASTWTPSRRHSRAWRTKGT